MPLTLVPTNVQVITIRRVRLTCGHVLYLTGNRTHPFGETSLPPGTMTYCHACMSRVQTSDTPEKIRDNIVMVNDWYTTEEE